MTVTTSNTQALDYLVSVNMSVSNSAQTSASFRVLVGGVEAADSVLTSIDTVKANERIVVSLQCRVNVTTGKVIKVQMLTPTGTLTIHERSISERGAA